MAEQRRSPVAMVVGKSGMGKSTLCNYLLFGNPRPAGGFSAVGGVDPETSICEAKTVRSTDPPRRFADGDRLRPGGPLTMIDTPGMPDPEGRTLEFYNDIVNTARRTGGLNALIVTVCFSIDRAQTQHDFETYRILLTQFEKMPVLKILLCRVRLQPDLTEEQRETDMVPVREWVRDILDRGGMRSAEVKFLIDDDTQGLQLFNLRRHVTEMPWIPIHECNMRTYDELKESAERLVALDTRLGELQAKKVELELEREQLGAANVTLNDKANNTRMHGSIWSNVVRASGMLLSIASLGEDAGSFAAAGDVLGNLTKKTMAAVEDSIRRQITANEGRQSDIDEEVAAIDRELGDGFASLEGLQRDRTTLDQLERVARATTTATPPS
ncbi:unnamed protein product [Ectocarpus fasciculatus]